MIFDAIYSKIPFKTYLSDHRDEKEEKFIAVFNRAIEAIKHKSNQLTIDDIVYKMDPTDLSHYTELFFKNHSPLQEETVQTMLTDIDAAAIANHRFQQNEAVNLKKLLILNTKLDESIVDMPEAISSKIIELQKSKQLEIRNLQDKINVAKKENREKNYLKAVIFVAGTSFIVGCISLAIFLNPLFAIMAFLTLSAMVFILADVSTSKNINELQNRLSGQIDQFLVLEKAKIGSKEFNQYLNKYGESANNDILNDETEFIKLLRKFNEAQNVDRYVNISKS